MKPLATPPFWVQSKDPLKWHAQLESSVLDEAAPTQYSLRMRISEPSLAPPAKAVSRRALVSSGSDTAAPLVGQLCAPWYARLHG